VSQKTEIDKWDERLDDGERYRKDFGDSEMWARWRDYMRNKFAASSKVRVNVVNSTLRTMLAMLYSDNPAVHMHSRRPPSDPMTPATNLLEWVVYWIMQRTGFKEEMRLNLLDTSQVGTGVMKFGFDTFYGAFGGAQYDPVLGTGLGLIDSRGRRVEFDQNLPPGLPWARHVASEDFFAPFGTIRIHRAPWCAFRIIRPFDEAKRDTRYTPRARGALQANRWSPFPGPDDERFHRSSQRKGRKTVEELVELREIWDLEKRKVMVYAPDCPYWLVNEETDLMDNLGLPVAPMVFNEDTQCFWGVSDVALIEDQQRGLNETWTQIQQHRRRTARGFAYTHAAIDPEELAKLERGVVGEGIAVKGKLSDAFQQFQFLGVPQELMQIAQMEPENIREQVGMSRNTMGAFSIGTRRTAKEVENVAQGSSARVEDRKINAIAPVVIRCAEWFIDVITRTRPWTQEKVATIVGEELAPLWPIVLQMTRTMFDINIDMDPVAPETREQREQRTMMYLQLFAGMGIPPQAVLQELGGTITGVNAGRILQQAQQTQQAQQQNNSPQSQGKSRSSA